MEKILMEAAFDFASQRFSKTAGKISVFASRGGSERWHKGIEVLAETISSPLNPDLQSLNQDIEHLRQQTDLYLKGKKKITAKETDTRLANLIRKESRKELAVAATAHRISAHALREVLQQELDELAITKPSPASFLRAIIIAHLIKKDAVTTAEARLARDLLPLFSGPDITSDLEKIVYVMLSGVPASSLLYRATEHLATAATRQFLVDLKELANNHQWAAARKKTAFLADISIRSATLNADCLRPELIFRQAFSAWLAWANWQPNAARLQLADKISVKQREIFSDFLVLEGPDVVTQQKPTLRDGLAAHDASLLSWGKARVRLRTGRAIEAKEVLGKLAAAMERACRGSRSDRKLLEYLFIGRDIELEGLRFWEGVMGLGLKDAQISKKILRFFKSETKSLDKQYDIIVALLITFRDPIASEVRATMAPLLASCAEGVLRHMQAVLCEQLDKRMLVSNAKRLHAFGTVLQKDDWVFVFFPQELSLLLRAWPSHEEVNDLEVLRTATLTQLSSEDKILIQAIEVYMKSRLVTQGFVHELIVQKVTTVLDIWHRPGLSDETRALSIVLCQDQGPAWGFRFDCLSQIPDLSPKLVAILHRSLKRNAKKPDVNCIELSRALCEESTDETLQCWRPYLTKLLLSRDKTLIEKSLEILGPVEWLGWNVKLGSLYNDMIAKDSEALPNILRPAFHAWVARLASLADLIDELWKTEEVRAAIKIVLLGYKLKHAHQYFEKLVVFLPGALERPTQNERDIILQTVKSLTEDGNNAEEVSAAINFMTNTTSEGMEACSHILDIYQSDEELQPRDVAVAGRKSLAELIFGSILYELGLDKKDQLGLKAFGALLGLHPATDDSALSNGLDGAAEYLEAEIATLLQEARNLESLRLGYKVIDPAEAAKVLLDLGIENPSRLDDELSSLPADCVDLIEQINDSEIELHFPLTGLTNLQRIGMGIGAAQNMIVRLEYSNDRISGFCIHLDTEQPQSQKSRAHRFIGVLEGDEADLDNPTCYTQPTRISYQLTRALYKWFRNKSPLLSEVHQLVRTSIPDFGRQCIVCGSGKSALHRSTLCGKNSCKFLWRNAHYDLLLSDIRHDPEVVDLLLTMVHLAATSKNAALLPDCPFTDSAKVLLLLAKVPKIEDLKDHDNVYGTLKSRIGCHDTEVFDLLVWVLSSYRGFLTSATGKLRIPALPNSHQFLLANTSPESESAFTAHLGTKTSSVLFHGTSPERMLSILHTGLRNLSGTPLQKHGASHGKGVYVATEPATSMGYCTPIPASSGIGWKHSKYAGCRFLLGVEHAGPSTAKYTGIHVIEDPTKLAVRYIFLLPVVTNAPVSQHVVPAMGSTFAGLRSRVL